MGLGFTDPQIRQQISLRRVVSLSGVTHCPKTRQPVKCSRGGSLSVTVRHSTQSLLDHAKENTARDSGLCQIFILSHLPPPLNNPRSLHRDLFLWHCIAQECVCIWPFPPAFQFFFWPIWTRGEDVLKVTQRNILGL